MMCPENVELCFTGQTFAAILRIAGDLWRVNVHKKTFQCRVGERIAGFVPGFASWLLVHYQA